MKQRAHPTVNTNITNVLSKIRGGGVNTAESQDKLVSFPVWKQVGIMMKVGLTF